MVEDCTVSSFSSNGFMQHMFSPIPHITPAIEVMKVMECQLGVIPACRRVLIKVTSVPLCSVQINTHSQKDLTDAGTTYNK
ncbi:hypothetical protein PAMP_000813 [Pampus punctatissimus]